MANLKIDLSQPFPQLSRAPVVEALIAISSRASISLEEGSLLDYVKAKLSEYPVRASHQAFRHTILAETPSEPRIQDMGWRGIQCQTSDGLQVTEFNRDGFVFSRLAPYESWSQFSEEALRLWMLYVELAKPLEIQRASVRFINKIDLPVGAKIQDFLTAGPRPPDNLPLPFAGFLIQNTFVLQEPSLGVQVTQTVPPTPEAAREMGLILDINAFTGRPFEVAPEALSLRFAQLRWLKNKVFFGSLKVEILEKFK